MNRAERRAMMARGRKKQKTSDFPTASEAVEQASEDDRIWFEANPGRNQRLRAAVPGEYGPVENEIKSKLVLVTQVEPGFRFRRPVSVTPKHPGNGGLQ